jgi:hypothetical protein
MSRPTREHGHALEAQRQTERIYAELRARRDQLQSEYEEEVRSAVTAFEGGFCQNMQVAEANGPQTVAMVEEVMATKKDLEVKELENRLRLLSKFSDAIAATFSPVALYNTVSETHLGYSWCPLETPCTHCVEAATCLVSKPPSSLASGTHECTPLFRPTFRQRYRQQTSDSRPWPGTPATRARSIPWRVVYSVPRRRRCSPT